MLRRAGCDEGSYLDQVFQVSNVAAQVQNQSCSLDFLRHVVLHAAARDRQMDAPYSASHG